jgi:hypothetical protein
LSLDERTLERRAFGTFYSPGNCRAGGHEAAESDQA